MKEDAHKFKGVKRSTHPINQDSQYLWDAHNIRFENKGDGTFLSIVNETEPQLITDVNLPYGDYVGHCVLGKFLVVFITNSESNTDYIYKLYEEGGTYQSKILF